MATKGHISIAQRSASNIQLNINLVINIYDSSEDWTQAFRFTMLFHNKFNALEPGGNERSYLNKPAAFMAFCCHQTLKG